MKDENDKQQEQCCKYGASAMMCPHGDHYPLIRWLLGAVILVVVFWSGFQFGSMTTSLKYGWEGNQQFGRSWTPMMYQYDGTYNNLRGPGMMRGLNRYGTQSTAPQEPQDTQTQQPELRQDGTLQQNSKGALPGMMRRNGYSTNQEPQRDGGAQPQTQQ